MRALISLVILFAILFFPYWVYLPLLVLAIITVPIYWESIVLGFLIDVFYGAPTHYLWLPFGFAAAVLVLLALPVRNYFRFHA